MRKKIITGILLVCLMGLGSQVYAATAEITAPAAKGALQERIQNIRDIRSEIQPQLATIRDNRTEILELRAEARRAHSAAVAHIKELRQDVDNLTDEQIDALKDAVDILRQHRIDFSATLGDIWTETLVIRSARRDQDVEQIKDALDRIIAVQAERIELLETSIADMNSILDI